MVCVPPCGQISGIYFAIPSRACLAAGCKGLPKAERLFWRAWPGRAANHRHCRKTPTADGILEMDSLCCMYVSLECLRTHLGRQEHTCHTDLYWRAIARNRFSIGVANAMAMLEFRTRESDRKSTRLNSS